MQLLWCPSAYEATLKDVGKTKLFQNWKKLNEVQNMHMNPGMYCNQSLVCPSNAIQWSYRMVHIDGLMHERR